MKYYELVYRIHKKFYQSFAIDKDRQYFDVQSKLLTSAILFIIMEKTLGKDDPEFKKARISISRTIDKEVFENQDLMRRARIYEETKEFGFAYMEIYSIKRKLEAVNKAIEQGSLADALPHLLELLYVTYVKPMSKYDDEHYMERYTSEVLRLKPIFLNDYTSFSKIVRDALIEQQVIDKS